MSLRATAAAPAVPPPLLGPPPLPHDHLPRPELLRRLEEAAGMVCLVAAPAGFGKTTLLAQWAQGAPAGSLAWLTLDEAEGDPAVLWTHLRAALGAEGEPRDGTLAAAIALAEAAGPTTLILDGYERIAGSPGEAELWRFVAERPPLQLVLAGRGEPTVPLAAARARGELFELRTADLRLGRREALELAGDAAADLVDACAGWPAALRLARTAASPRAWEELVLELVTDEVLADRPDAHAFLLGTAILDELTPSACDAVLETAGSAETLADLERLGLLVERSGPTGTYVLEPAARRALRAELESGKPRLASSLHARAAAAERAAGRREAAVEHLLACGDTAAAGRTVAAIWGHVTDAGGQERVLEWLERLPAGTQDVRLALARGWLLRLDGRRAESERWLDLARTAAPLGLRPAVVRACVLARAALPWDDVGAATTLARRAWRTERNGPRRPLGAWAVGWAAWWSGELDAATDALMDALEGPRLVEVAARAVLGRVELERGEVGEADAHVAAAERLVAEHGLGDLPELGMLATARGAVAEAQGFEAAALTALTRGIRLRRLWGHPLETADALTVAAPVVGRERGRRAAGALLVEARRLLAACTDPGVATERLAAATRIALPQPFAGAWDDLTPRERTVLRLLSQGLSKREIAGELHVSFNTVHSHTKAVYRKLGVSSRREAVERASEITIR